MRADLSSSSAAAQVSRKPAATTRLEQSDRQQKCYRSELFDKSAGKCDLFGGVVDCQSGRDCPNGQWVTPVWSVINNTFLNLSEKTSPNAAIWLEKSLGGNMVGDFRIKGNIIWNGAGFVNARNSPGAGTAGALQKIIGCSADCDDDHFSANIILGTKQTTWKAGAVLSNCPSPAASCPDFAAATFDDPVYGQLFRNFTGGVYGVRDFHAWAKRATAWGDVGADTDQLPEIRNLRVTTTDTRAMIQWQVTDPISVVPCIIHAGTTPDLESSHSYNLDNVVPFLRPGNCQRFRPTTGTILTRMMATRDRRLKECCCSETRCRCHRAERTGTC